MTHTQIRKKYQEWVFAASNKDVYECSLNGKRIVSVRDRTLTSGFGSRWKMKTTDLASKNNTFHFGYITQKV